MITFLKTSFCHGGSSKLPAVAPRVARLTVTPCNHQWPSRVVGLVHSGVEKAHVRGPKEEDGIAQRQQHVAPLVALALVRQAAARHRVRVCVVCCLL